MKNRDEYLHMLLKDYEGLLAAQKEELKTLPTGYPAQRKQNGKLIYVHVTNSENKARPIQRADSTGGGNTECGDASLKNTKAGGVNSSNTRTYGVSLNITEHSDTTGNNKNISNEDNDNKSIDKKDTCGKAIMNRGNTGKDNRVQKNIGNNDAIIAALARKNILKFPYLC